MRLINSIAFLLLLLGGTSAFVFSCNEIKNKLINSNLEESTRFVCLVPQEGYSAVAGLTTIYAQNDKVSTSFADLASSETTVNCVERPGTGSWRIVADLPVNLDCSMELTLIFTSSPIDMFKAGQDTTYVGLSPLYGDLVLVAPQTGLSIDLSHLKRLQPTTPGNITVYTGAGTGVAEYRYLMASWRLNEAPRWIKAFDNVITLACEGCEADLWLQIAYTVHDPNHYELLENTDYAVVMMSGRSDNAQILNPERNVAIFMAPGGNGHVSATATVSSAFQRPQDSVSVQFKDDCTGSSPLTQWFNNASTVLSANTNWVTVRYTTDGTQELWDSTDNFIVEISTTDTSPCGTAVPPKTTPKAPISNTDLYCNCAVDKFGQPIEGVWDPLEIWLDVVIILDVTSDMGDVLLGDASTLIESFFGSDDGDVLNTNTNANFFTRVGLIAMSDKPETLYNLNMTKADKVVGKVQVKTGVSSIDVIAAFNAAQNMLNDGLKTIPSRSSTRQVIYYMTNADPKFDPNTLESFKKSKGVIIVNDFVENGNINRPGLKDLASPGYYHNDIQDDYMDTIQLFCKANCYCRSEVDLVPYAGSNKDIALQAAGGCYRASSVGAQYGNAKSNCATTAPGGALVASIHDDDKGAFVNDLVIKSGTTKDYYWIGYTKTDAGMWKWEDQSTNPYEHWDTGNGEPLQNSASKCTYVDKTTILWGAGNCNTGMPFVCEYTPCQVGNKNC